MRKNIYRHSRLCLLLAVVFLFSAVRPLYADFRFTATGDPRYGLSRWRWVLSQMADKVGDEGVFHITAGDYYEDGAKTTASDFYEALKAQFGDDVMWYPGVGNHEIHTRDMPWLRNYYYGHLEGMVNPGPANGVETTYSWDYENAHFVQLNMYYNGKRDDASDDGDFKDALYDWLVEDLDNNTKPVIFVIYHQPAYPKGRGDKESPPQWRRFWKLLNDRNVVAGLCADTHTYARYQVDGDWDTFTWEIDSGNAGRMSHGDSHQTFIDITVKSNGVVQFDTWQGRRGQEFTLTDSWTAVVLIVELVGPPDGATVDANGAVLSCEPVEDTVSYRLLFGPDPWNMVFLVSDTPAPPNEVVTTFPFEQTWWTVKVRDRDGHTGAAYPRSINAQNVVPQVVENLTTGKMYDCIQSAIDDANSGEEIVVDAGICSYHENIDFKGKNLTVRSTNPDDPAVVAAAVITGASHRKPVVTFSSREGPTCMLAGFTITGGEWGIFSTTNAWPTITNCSIVSNRSYGIWSYSDWFCAIPTISGCTIANNGGSGIAFWRAVIGKITNCTIVGNGGPGFDALRNYARLTINNSIIWGNSHSEINNSARKTFVTHSDIKGCGGSGSGWDPNFGTDSGGNIDADPCFVQLGYWADANDPNIPLAPDDPNAIWVNGDYRLLAGSLCIDAGDNNSVPADVADLDDDGNTTEPVPWDINGRPRVIGGRIDMGAYEFNHIPVADPGPNQTLYTWIQGLTKVTLDGTGSYDAEGHPLTYNWSWTIGDETYTVTGPNTVIELPTGVHVVALIVNDGIDYSEPNQVTIAVVPPAEAAMKLTPQTLNCDSKGNWVKAHFVLPEGFCLQDVDVNTPAVAEPMGVVSKPIKPIGNDAGPVRLEVCFDRAAFCDSLTNGGSLEVTVVGCLTTGQYFCGTNTIRIISRP